MEFLIFVGTVLLVYLHWEGLSRYSDAASQEIAIKAKELELKNQRKLRRLKRKIEQQDEWLTVSLLEELIDEKIGKNDLTSDF